ncbi:MAG: proteasome subunit beta [Fervidicoccaceae archaeon]|jgi:proteasome beta subunit|nr:MAG: proteasome subunit beta [Fervidicoccus sp.]
MSESLYQGATVVGIKFQEGIVIAGERRMTYGSYIQSSNVKKVFLINERMGLGAAGMVGDLQNIIRLLKEQIRYYEGETKNRMKVRSAAKLLSNILYSLKIFPAMAEFIIGGIEDGVPVLAVLDPVGSVLEDDFIAVGSGGSIAIGVIEELYKTNMSETEAVELAVKAVRQGIRRDALSGGDIDYIVVTKEKSYEGKSKL